MKYEMMQTTGALQEGLEGSRIKQRHKRLVPSEDLRSRSSSKLKKSLISDGLTGGIQEVDQDQDFFRGKGISSIRAGKSGLEEFHMQEKKGMFFYTIPEGKKVLVTDKQGRGNIIDGPCRLWVRGKRFQSLEHYIAYPGEFLIVRHRDGSQEHIPGPKEQWLDPRVHASIQKEDALQIAEKEAVVVYAKNKDDQVKRRVVVGPALFVPYPGEWLHTFSWHGAPKGESEKVPGGLKFQKLWLMPDQMYHDVREVSTADDVMLTIKLMIFFELENVEKMLAGSHDPIGDFINATSSDVIDLIGRYSFDELKKHTDKLNDLASYPQLLNRAEQVGYVIPKVVYRGNTTSSALQTMHEQSIEARTSLKLARETEEQSQKLADFKQNCEYERAIHTREQEKQQQLHELETQKAWHQQEMQFLQEKKALEQEEKKQKQEDKLRFFQEIKKMGVDLTPYLTQGRADQVIELRGGDSSPHLHLSSPGKGDG